MNGITVNKDTLPSRGERVAGWVEDYMAAHGDLTVSELAFRLHADKRDLRRLLQDRSCGWRLEDSLAAYFGWDFVEAVFTPAVGADPLTAREIELAQHQAQAAAMHARILRERAARTHEPAAVVVGRGASVLPLQRRGRGRGEGAQAPESV